MPVEQGTIFIAAPINDVFDFLADSKNLYPMLRANMISEAYDLKPLVEGGYEYRWRYKILGLTLDAQSRTVEFERPTRFAVQSEGGVDTLSRWIFEPRGEGTFAAFSIEYAMNNAMIGWLTQRFAANQVRYSVEVGLMALRNLLYQHLGGKRNTGPLNPAKVERKSDQVIKTIF